MIDFVDARRKMVDSQIRPNDVTNLDLIATMLAVPRELFVPAELKAVAYADRDVPVGGHGRPARCLLKPMVLARLIQAAQLTAADRVLDVGCASGYSTALLAQLAKEVVALDEDPELARTAERVLRELGTANAKVVVGPLGEGWKALGPYDVILVNGAMEREPEQLLAQLADGGRLVGIMGTDLAGRAVVHRLDRGEVSTRPVFNAAAPLLSAFTKPPAFVF